MDGNMKKAERKSTMPPMPTTVKIGWRDFAIEEWEHIKANAARRYGEQSDVEGKIRVDISFGHQRAAETLLHEILHAIHNVFDLGKSPDDERIVTVTSNGIATVWRDNPPVMRWISEGLTSSSATRKNRD